MTTDRENFERTFNPPHTIKWSEVYYCYLHDGKLDHESEKWDAALAGWQMCASLTKNEVTHALIDMNKYHYDQARYQIKNLVENGVSK